MSVHNHCVRQRGGFDFPSKFAKTAAAQTLALGLHCIATTCLRRAVFSLLRLLGFLVDA
ncbi:MAG: hypothetical protein RL701_4247 [Pseudomonadota bacterium]